MLGSAAVFGAEIGEIGVQLDPAPQIQGVSRMQSHHHPMKSGIRAVTGILVSVKACDKEQQVLELEHKSPIPEPPSPALEHQPLSRTFIPNSGTSTFSPGPPSTSHNLGTPNPHLPNPVPSHPPSPCPSSPLCCGVQPLQTPGMGAVAGLLLTQHIPNLPHSLCCFPGFTQTQGWVSFPGRNYPGIQQTLLLWNVLPSSMTALFHLPVTALK